MNDLTVTVTVADLDAALANVGFVHICAGCLLAVAATRALGEPVEVGYHSAWVPGKGEDRRSELNVPPAARTLIDAFDNRAFDELRGLLPVTFVMEAR